MIKKIKKLIKAVFKKGLARRKLHALWSITVRERDGFKCQWCAHDGRTNVNLKHHAHHIVSRSLSGTNGAFDVDNGMTLCYYCHMNRLKAEVDEYIAFRDVWLKQHLDMTYPEMREKFRPMVKFTEEFYGLKRDSLEYVRRERLGRI